MSQAGFDGGLDSSTATGRPLRVHTRGNQPERPVTAMLTILLIVLVLLLLLGGGFGYSRRGRRT
jgi:hypothetical protein